MKPDNDLETMEILLQLWILLQNIINVRKHFFEGIQNDQQELHKIQNQIIGAIATFAKIKNSGTFKGE